MTLFDRVDKKNLQPPPPLFQIMNFYKKNRAFFIS